MTSRKGHKLLVRVVEASDLPRGDIVSSDPYVKVKVGGLFHHYKKTKVLTVRYLYPMICDY